MMSMRSAAAGDGIVEKPLYKDAKAPVEKRVNDLLSRMTLDEKIAQICCIWDGKKTHILDGAGNFDPGKAAKNLPLGIGQIARPSEGTEPAAKPNRAAGQTAELTNAIQRFFVEKTRLGIPVLFHEECLHGHMGKGSTHFPVPIALAATWDDVLVEQIFTAVAGETRCRGVHQGLAPVVDVAREPRWGRFEETYGEDPYLVSRMGIAAVKGLQGTSPVIDGHHISATLKHFAAHGQPESGMNVGPAAFSERLLREVFLAPFRACVLEANPHSIMASYNELDGIPSHANSWLLRDVLRGEWGFTGCVVADYYGIQQLYERHHVAATTTQAGETAISAGVDIELPDPLCYPLLKDQVRKGTVPVATLDTAVARVLRRKFSLGLFENPFVDAKAAAKITGCKKNRELARLAAEKAIILLKNEHRLLPLRIKNYKTIGVIGPNADQVLLGGYSDMPREPVTLLQGIKKRVANGAKILYSEGCRITEAGSWSRDTVDVPNPTDEEKRMTDAIETAQRCDIIILALGGNEQVSREAYYEKHLGDAATLDLIGNQIELTKKILTLGKPVVAVLYHGRPQSIGFLKDNVPAILDCWYLGEEAGNATAAALFGDITPGGKLPASIPRSVGHIPCFYNYKPTARRGYLFDDVSPLFAFGFGSSYTTFSFSAPKLAKRRIAKNETTAVSVEVQNTGPVAGDEVVQMYIHDPVGSVTRPVKELKGFRRITLKPGEKATVGIEITPEKLSFYDKDMRYAVEPGDYEILTGPSSRNEDLKKAVLTVE